MKPRLKPIGRKQQDLLNKEKEIRKPPDPIAAAALKGLSDENKKGKGWIIRKTKGYGVEK